MKLLKYTLTTTFTFLAASCANLVDKINPTHILDKSNAFKTIENFEAALNGAYSQLRSVNLYGRNQSVMPDMMSDNLKESPENLPQGTRGMVDWVYAADNGAVADAWLGLYTVINSANIVINGIDDFTTSTNQKTANRIKGQALALRAWLHFDLLKWFANSYDRNSNEPAVPIMTQPSTNNPNLRPPRATVKEVYDRIFADLNEALRLLSDVDRAINTATRRVNIDATTVNAMLARICLYAGLNAEAIRFATNVINALPLATRTQFPAIWRDESAVEVAWAIRFNPGEGGPALEVYSPAGADRASFDASPDLAALYDRANDIRFSSYLAPGFGTRAPRPQTRIIPIKYLGKGNNRDGVVDFKVLRTGEMYLIRAEARLRTGDTSGALQDLNTLRAARIQNFVPGNETGEALVRAIADERRRELFLEGHRWFDLKRTTRTINRQNCTPPATQCNLAPNSPRWTWPIPIVEINANPNMTQNPGY
ncbi:MAG: RagB/SusD family nutrient uptake outer membrane protein [Cytophagales bacterium]|nr:RagB/SusD family nutrient uptake outer membrane protein [Bernardetiaceae bacterium]MDW8211517.1 RagB/SusD family nutrient uptake outer membrane protein [Cytophagales bacterium]